MPKGLLVLAVASPTVPLVCIGVLKVQSDGQSWVGLVPFVLVAALLVVLVLSVYAARDQSSQNSSEPYWPRSRLGVWAYVAALFFLPLMLVALAAITLLTDHYLVAGILLAMAVTPTLLKVETLRQVHRDRTGPSERNESRADDSAGAP